MVIIVVVYVITKRRITIMCPMNHWLPPISHRPSGSLHQTWLAGNPLEMGGSIGKSPTKIVNFTLPCLITGGYIICGKHQ